MERKEIFSIKKLKVGAASVLIGTGIVFLGSEASVALANESVVETTVNRANSDDVGDNSVNLKNSLNNDKMGVNSSTTPQQVDTNSIKPTNKNSGKISKRSKRALTDSETIDYSGVKISGKLINSKTEYAVGEQILGSYNLDVSSPSKIEEGGYILVTASNNEPLDTFEIGKAKVLKKGKDITLIATGIMVNEMLKADEELEKLGVSCTLIDMHTIKPLDIDTILNESENTKGIVTCEEHSIIGGLFSAVSESLAPYGNKKIRAAAQMDTYGESGKPDLLREKYGLTSEHIVKEALAIINTDK